MKRGRYQLTLTGESTSSAPHGADRVEASLHASKSPRKIDSSAPHGADRVEASKDGNGKLGHSTSSAPHGADRVEAAH